MTNKQVSSIENDADCINNAPMFKFLDEQGIDPSSICEKLGKSRAELTKPGNMVSIKVNLAIMEGVKEVLNQSDPRIFYLIGLESTRLGSYGVLMDMVNKLGNTEKAVRFIPRFNRKFNDLFEMPVYNVTNNSGVVVVHYKEKPGYDKLWKVDMDFWNEGVIASIPSTWNLSHIETNTILTRFSIEDIFRDYAFMGHILEKKGHSYHVKGVGEIAEEVILETEEVERSLDMIDGFFKKPKLERILTNKGATEIYKVKNEDKEHLPTGVRFVKDFQISDLWTIPEGTIAGAEYSRIDLSWQGKKKFGTKIYGVVWGDRQSSKNIIQALEEELTSNKEKTYEIERLLTSEQQLTTELAAHRDSLEEKVGERTAQLSDAIRVLSYYQDPRITQAILESREQDIWDKQEKELTIFGSSYEFVG